MSVEVSRAYWKAVQTALKKHGFDPGTIDGERGLLTDGALIRFKSARGLKARPYIGPVTEQHLWADPQPLPAGQPRWFARAHTYLGLKEIAGPRDNPQVLAWWALIGAGWFDDDETPWCGAFVGGVLKEERIDILPGSQAPRARAWEAWGRRLDGPAVGAVVTFWRESPSSGNGHVAFVAGRLGDDLVCLGGNQSNMVCLRQFDTARVTGYRWPTGEPLPAETGFSNLPRLTGAGVGGSVT